MSRTIVKISDLNKCYKKDIKANDNITLDFNTGEITALIGHNGAGKTTLLNQIIGIVKPTTGRIIINGNDVIKRPEIARNLVSSMPQFQAPLKGVTVFQSIENVLRIKGFSKHIARQKTNEIIDFLEIGKWSNLAGEKLSGGLQRLTSFAMTVMSDSQIIILDEPTNDVDPIRRLLMWKYLKKLANKGTLIILVTHNLLEVEKYANRYILLDKGRIKADVNINNKVIHHKHTLNIYGIEERNIAIFDEFKNSSYYSLDRKLVIHLNNNDILKAVEILLKILEENKAIDYEIKMGTLYDDYEEMIYKND